MSVNTEAEKLLKLVNSSGFLFQLRVAQEIANSQSQRPWTVMAQEHPWSDASTGHEGFIDLVIGKGIARMVIECKRTRDADWVFLVPADSENSAETRVRCMWIDAPQNASLKPQLKSGWHNFFARPESFTSEFCIVRGTGEGQRPMLENLCRQLLDSAESLAREELSLIVGKEKSIKRYYVPAIVTNARLFVCHFDIDSVSIKDGEILNGNFEPVPYIRFGKSLATKLLGTNVDTLEAANLNRHRTVLVVQALHLLPFLEQWQRGDMENDPWT
jgi:hypothetical protein